jgi:HSP20 family molecular chaperone IbpA
MAFSPRAIVNPDTSFSPLFRLLDDFDHYSRQEGGHQHSRRSTVSAFQPRFDVRETRDSYELHGELPGMGKENLHVEFTDPQAIVISGKIERTYTAGTPLTGQIEDITTQPAITERESKEASTSTSVEKKQGERENFASNARYWLTERSVGTLSRRFNFPAPVDQDAVSASLKDGVLSIMAPKAKKVESRRIAIN